MKQRHQTDLVYPKFSRSGGKLGSPGDTGSPPMDCGVEMGNEEMAQGVEGIECDESHKTWAMAPDYYQQELVSRATPFFQQAPM